MKANNPKKANDTESKSYTAFKIVMAVLVCVVVILAIIFYPRTIPFWEFNVGDVVMLLLSLFVVALFIERAVEVIMIVWRDSGEKECQRKVDKLEKQIKAKSESNVENLAEDKEEAERDLKHYKAVTKTLALTLVFVIGIVISALGIRALQPLVDMTVFKDLTAMQKTLFAAVDIIITGALLGGGSKGIHEIVEAFLNTVERYRKFIKSKP